MTDNAKYQKLATEYAKLKSQLPVLKKAFLDEQTSTNQLKDDIKRKDQSIRKFEQEIDSLNFRNQQLSKRVEFLQDELDVIENSKKKKVKHTEPAVVQQPTSPGVYNEELFNKIQENERLHKLLDENNRKYEDQIQELETKLSEYERQCSQHQSVLSTTLQSNKEQIDKLQQNKALLEIKLQKLENEVKTYRGRAELAEEKLDTENSRLESALCQARKIIADKLPFIDTKCNDWNGLNLPTHDRKHQTQARELVGQASSHFSDLIQSLSNFFTYFEQRTKIYPADGVSDPISPINVQFCKYLHENLSYLRPTEEALRSFFNSLNEDSLTTLETATELKVFSRKFDAMVAYMNKLLPYQMESIKEESEVSSCTSSLKAKNMELLNSLRQFNTEFNKMKQCVSLLAAQSDKNNVHPQNNHPVMLAHLAKVLRDFDGTVKNLSKQFNSKVNLEHQMPTATQKLKTTNECIVSSLITMVTCSGKMATFMTSNLDLFKQSVGYRTRGSSIGTDASICTRSNPATMSFRSKASRYMSQLDSQSHESVPHKTAVQNRKVLLSSAERKEGLTKQLTTAQTKVSKLEQEKEHWMLELQLLQIKYDAECQKLKKLEADHMKLVKENSKNDTLEDHISAEPEEAPIKVAPTTDTRKEADTSGREMLIKNHFTTRINELTSKLQVADSKAVSFYSEVKALHKQLEIAEKSKMRAEAELKDVTHNLTQLKDELQTTSKSYEGQLSMMSEHLASMNEKIAKQKDEIDDLRAHEQVHHTKEKKKFRR